MFTIYEKTGENIRCTTHKLEYNGTFMGECSVTVDVISPTPIDFHIGDYLEYRGERFEINYDPSVIKTARSQTVGDAFKYENIKFNSLSDELARVDFLDYVTSDNNVHFTSLPTFSFFCADVTDLARRIQANLDRVYTGSKKWTVSVHQDFVGKTDVNISVSNIKVWDALALASSDFEANFIIRGRTITIGTSGIAVGSMFAYGKNNGLFEIERNAESDQAIITRLRAYGSEKNLPPRYYNKITDGGGDSYLPNNMAVTRLMLPDFPNVTQDPYIDSANISELGVREGTVFFDGSDGNEEIYPSIEGMTYEGQHIDVVQSAEQTTDDGTWEVPEGETSVNIPNFTITLYNLGFDIRDYLIEGQNPSISMKSGLCAGREFEIVNVSQDAQTGYYTLECKRTEDSSLGLVFPYKDYNVKAGDKLVLLNISMPTEYITAASQRLYDAAVAYLAKCDYVRYSYSPKVDNIFLQRQHDRAIANSDTSIHDTIKEGDLLLFSDTDLGISGSIIIDQLTIKEGEELIPQYEITLRNDKTVGTIQRLQQQIDSIINGSTAVGGYNAQQIQSIIRAFGDTRYLRKDIDDVAKGLIDSLKGFQVGADFVSGLLGEGGIFRKDADGKTYIETDRLYVRLKAYFDEIEVKKYTHSGGNRIASKTGIKTVKVEYYDANDEIVEDASQAAYYRCYFRLTDDDGNTITNDWVVGDLARSQEFKQGTNGYWRAVVGVGSVADEDGLGYIDLSKTDCLSGSDVPQAQDDIIQLGNKNDTTRQGAIIEFSSGANAPSYQIYQNINSYDLTGKNVIALGYNSATNKAYMNVYGDAFIGNQNGSHIQYDSTTGNLTIKATIDAQSTIGTQTLEEYIQEHQTTWTEQEIETLITDSTSEQFADIDTAIETLKNQADGAIETWFYNGEPTLNNEPASSWNTTELKDRHLGDLYYDNSTGYAYRFTKTGSTYTWNPISDSAVAKALSDAAAAQTTANSKRRIFFTTPTPPYEQGDLWVNATYPANNTYTDATNNRYYNDVLRCKTTKASGSFSISDWTLASKYTDDSKFNSYVDQLLNHTIISNPSDAQQVANTYNSVMQALNQGTIIDGGLVLSTLIGLRDSNDTVWAGLSGAYDTQAKGNGIASWFGGAMVDWETLTSAQQSAAQDGDYAKSLFRMDGTGYVASGNISWDSLGRVTLKNVYTDTGDSIDELLSLFSITMVSGTPYIDPQYTFANLNVRNNSGSIVSLKDIASLFVPHYNSTTGALESIEATVPLWSQGEVSALGYDGSSGGGGGGGGTDLAAVWATLTGNTGTYKDYQIHSGHLTSALANYALSSNLATVATSGSYNDLTNKPTIPAAQIQSDWNQTTTTAKDYIKNKPTLATVATSGKYSDLSGVPTKVSAFTNDANYVTSSSLTTTLASYATQTWVTNKGYATTSAMNTELAKYLPLAGGTMSNTNKVTNLNADLLDGYEATDMSRLGWVTTQNESTSVCSWFEVGVPSSTAELYSYEIITKRSTSTYPTIEHYRLDVFRYSSAQLSISLVNTGVSLISGNLHKVCAAISTNGKVYVQHGSTGATSQRMFIRPLYNAGSVSTTAVGSGTYAVASGFTAVGIVEITGYLKTSTDGTSILYTGDTQILTPSAAALKLKNARTLWGQSFDGSANISGNMTGVGTLTASGLITANGNIKAASYIEIGDYRIVADTANTALKVVNKDGSTAVNFYATGENSALGVNTSGGGGGGDGASLEAVWTSLGSSTGTYGSTQINASHLTSALSGYLPLTGGTLSGNLSVKKSMPKVIVANDSITASLYLASNNDRGLYDDTNSHWIIGTNGTNTFLLDGNVGINIASPSYKLHVSGTFGVTGQMTSTLANGTAPLVIASSTLVTNLNADLLDGIHASGLFTALSNSGNNISLTIGGTNKTLTVGYATSAGSATSATSATSADTATTLKNARTIWGQSFNGSANVKGTLYMLSSSATSLNSSSAKLKFNSYTVDADDAVRRSPYIQAIGAGYGGYGRLRLSIFQSNAANYTDDFVEAFTVLPNGNVGVNTIAPTYQLHVSGTLGVTGQITSTVANGTAPLVVASSTLVSNLNADKLDGVDASGLFTALSNSGNNISVTIGGTNKTLQVGYAASAGSATSAGTATTLANARTLWGQSFNGSANVSGNMTGVGSLEASGTITVTKSGTTSARTKVINGNGGVSLLASTNRGVYDDETSKWVIATNGTNTFLMDGNVGIGTTSPSYNLHIDGTLGVTGQITSSVATGTSPLSVASTTLNTNLNADLLDGYHATDIPRLGWTSVANGTTSSDQCKWYEVGVPTTSGAVYVYEIMAYRSVYPLLGYYKLAIYRYNANIVNVSLINQGFNYRNANNARLCVAIDANQKVYIQSGSRTASNYIRIRPLYNLGSINTTAVGEAAFGTANGFTALKMVTDSGYFRVDTSAATQATTYDGDPMMITSLRIGDAFIWWDSANSCLRISGAGTGKPSASVAINVNVSGEITALKTS